jgi:hypothetical protein
MTKEIAPSKDTIETEQDDQATNEKRRELLIQLGKIAIYTPPAMLTLMVSKKASAQSCGPLDECDIPPPPP